MRRLRITIAVALAACLGCLGKPDSRTSNWLDRLRPFSGPSGPDTVFAHVAVLERPAGDDFLDREIWASVDTQVIEAEAKAVLDDNGFRIGLIAGMMPERLDRLLLSKKACLGARHLETRAGNPLHLDQGPEWPSAEAELLQDGRVTPRSFERAQCALQMVVTPLPDGRARLRFVPQVQHGEQKLWPHANYTGSAVVAQGGRPTELFDALAWEVSLWPNEYLIVGGRTAKRATLGGLFFLGADPTVSAQRLLVIRAGRRGPAPAPVTAVGGTAPLAMQAATPAAHAVRGCSP
jgi:hypothetical protein